MAQPVRRGVRVATGALHDRLQDIIDPPFRDSKHAIRRRGVASHGQQQLRGFGRQQYVPSLIAFADERELNLAAIAWDDLRPRQRRDLGDAQGTIVGDLTEDALPAGLGGSENALSIELGQYALGELPRRSLQFDQGCRVELRVPDLMSRSRVGPSRLRWPCWR